MWECCENHDQLVETAGVCPTSIARVVSHHRAGVNLQQPHRRQPIVVTRGSRFGERPSRVSLTHCTIAVTTQFEVGRWQNKEHPRTLCYGRWKTSAGWSRTVATPPRR